MKSQHLILALSALALVACDSSTTEEPAEVFVPQSEPAKTVEVLHWWTSGGEAEALEVLKSDVESKGFVWQDMPIAGGGGDAAMTVLRSRITSGNAPTAAQMLGFDIRDWAKIDGAVGDLTPTALKEDWDNVVPVALQEFSKYNEKWVAAPVNVHSTNWIWINKEALDATGGKVPTTWNELVKVLDGMKEDNIIPLAHGGQAWQDATIFDAVVLSLGKDFYKASMIDLNPEALGGPKMVEAFRRMSVLRSYVDDDFSGRDWNLASAMVIEGKAGMQMMGDWAKAEFLNAGKQPGQDFVCIRFPGTEGSVTFNSDQFVTFDIRESDKDAQQALGSSVMNRSFQSSFNVIKGSVPARIDVSDSDFDDCGKKGIKDLSEANSSGTLYGSMAHGHAAPAPVKNAVYDVVTSHFNGKYNDAEATQALVTAIAAAK